MEKQNVIKVTCENALQVSRIYGESWKAAYKGIVPQSYLEHIPEDYWVPFLSAPQRLAFALEINGELVGSVSVSPGREKGKERWGEVISLYVLPAYFGTGCGQTLFSYGVELLYKMGFSNIYLWVLEENQRARTFYCRNGFRPNGDRETVCIGGKTLTELRYIHCAAEKREQCFNG